MNRILSNTKLQCKTSTGFFDAKQYFMKINVDSKFISC